MSGPSGTESDETRSHRGLGATTGETGVSGSPLEAVTALLDEVYIPEGVQIWLTSRNRNLDMQRPIDLLESDAERVLAEVRRLVGGAW